MKSDDFDTQFKNLEESVGDFKSQLHQIEEISEKFQWEVHGFYDENEQEESKDNKKVALAKIKREVPSKLFGMLGFDAGNIRKYE